MSEILTSIDVPPSLPDHTQLPDHDGVFVKNFQEHPQCIILTDSIGPTLARLHPEGDYCIGQDSGIYWRDADPPEQGAEAPDWFYVPHVPAQLNGMMRRSYVFWRELRSPLIALELASGNGQEERDQTPLSRSSEGIRPRPGKFWVYEQILHIAYYGIYEVFTGKLEVYHLENNRYQKITPNERGHYPIPELEVELGLWQGIYQNQEQLWLRWWDLAGNLLLTGSERAELEQQRREQERQRAEQERQRAEQERQRAEQERQRAESANQLVEQERQLRQQERHRAEQAEIKAAKLAELLRSMGIEADAN